MQDALALIKSLGVLAGAAPSGTAGSAQTTIDSDSGSDSDPAEEATESGRSWLLGILGGGTASGQSPAPPKGKAGAKAAPVPSGPGPARQKSTTTGGLASRAGSALGAVGAAAGSALVPVEQGEIEHCDGRVQRTLATLEESLEKG